VTTERRRTSSPEVPRISKVLLVDDSAAILSFVKAYLLRLNCDFVEAGDGHRALRLASLMLVDLVIADINMPGMDGITLTTELRKSDNPRLQKIPIILMSGDKDPELRRRALEAGAQDFVVKPVDGMALATVVGRLLRGDAP
jgi:two-component system, chemotaxis family, chemotaxis protein CheY